MFAKQLFCCFSTHILFSRVMKLFKIWHYNKYFYDLMGLFCCLLGFYITMVSNCYNCMISCDMYEWYHMIFCDITWHVWWKTIFPNLFQMDKKQLLISVYPDQKSIFLLLPWHIFSIIFIKTGDLFFVHIGWF